MCRISKGVMVSSTGCLHATPLVGALQNVASMLQFRPETAPGRVSVAWRGKLPTGAQTAPQGAVWVKAWAGNDAGRPVGRERPALSSVGDDFALSGCAKAPRDRHGVPGR